MSIRQLAVSLSVYTTLCGLFRLWLRGIEAALLCGSDVVLTGQLFLIMQRKSCWIFEFVGKTKRDEK